MGMEQINIFFASDILFLAELLEIDINYG